MSEKIVGQGIYKEQSSATDSLDLLTLAHDSLLEKFAEDFEGKVIPAKKLFWFFGIRWRFRKEQTKKLLKALSERYPDELSLNCHGLQIKEAR